MQMLVLSSLDLVSINTDGGLARNPDLALLCFVSF